MRIGNEIVKVYDSAPRFLKIYLVIYTTYLGVRYIIHDIKWLIDLTF